MPLRSTQGRRGPAQRDGGQHLASRSFLFRTRSRATLAKRDPAALTSSLPETWYEGVPGGAGPREAPALSTFPGGAQPCLAGLTLRGLSRVSVGWSRGLVLAEGSLVFWRDADEHALAKDKEQETFGGAEQGERSHRGWSWVTELLGPQCPHP